MATSNFNRRAFLAAVAASGAFSITRAWGAEDLGDPITEKVGGSGGSSSGAAAETEIEPLVGPQPFREVIFSADGKLMATTAGLQSNVREFAVWDVATWKKRCAFYARQGARTLHFSPDGKRLTVGTHNSKLVSIDTTTGKPTRRDFTGMKNADRFVLSPDGSLLAAANKKDFSIVIHETEKFAVKTTLKGHSAAVTAMAFSHDNRYLISGSQQKGSVIWDIEKSAAKHKSFVEGNIASVAFSRNGRVAANASYEGHIRAYSVGSGRRTHKVAGPKGGGAMLGRPERVTISSDGKLLAFSGSGPLVALYRLDREEASASAAEVGPLLVQLDDDNYRVRQRAMAALAKLGNAAANHLHNAMKEATSIEMKRRLKSLIDSLDSPRPDRVFAGHTGRIDGLAFSPDGKLLATGSHDNSLRIWDVASGKMIVTLSREEPEFDE